MILGFQNRFVAAVADGTKPHSIRQGTRWRVGMRIQFYQNVRQKSMAKIREDATATVVQEIKMWEDRVGWHLAVDGRKLNSTEFDKLARNDGFETYVMLFVFIEAYYGFPFTGQLIGWTDLRY